MRNIRKTNCFAKFYSCVGLIPKKYTITSKILISLRAHAVAQHFIRIHSYWAEGDRLGIKLINKEFRLLNFDLPPKTIGLH